MAANDPAQRKLVSRLGGLARSATEDPGAITAPARSAFRQRFIDRARADAPPDTSEAEVERRAAVLWKAHMTRLGLASAKARQQKGRAGTRPSAVSGEHTTPDASTEVDSTSMAEGGS